MVLLVLVAHREVDRGLLLLSLEEVGAVAEEEEQDPGQREGGRHEVRRGTARGELLRQVQRHLISGSFVESW